MEDWDNKQSQKGKGKDREKGEGKGKNEHNLEKSRKIYTPRQS